MFQELFQLTYLFLVVNSDLLLNPDVELQGQLVLLVDLVKHSDRLLKLGVLKIVVLHY